MARAELRHIVIAGNIGVGKSTLVALLAETCRWTPVSELEATHSGAGTCILTRLLLARGGTVFAVEPNAAMRQEAEATLGDHAGFTSIAATAEATGLPEASVDLITAVRPDPVPGHAAARRRAPPS